MKHRKLLLAGFILSLVALILLFILTDPVSIGLFGVLAIFAIIYYLIFCIIYCVSIVFFTIFMRGKKMNIKKTLAISAILSTAPVIIMSFLSLGGIGIPELTLVVLMIMIAMFFVNRKI